MKAVLAANVVVALVFPTPYSESATQQVGDLTEAGTEIFAPTLWIYEATSALRKASGIGQISSTSATTALTALLEFPITSQPPNEALAHAVLDWAGRLTALSVYDASYLAVAELLQADLWTADLRLVRNSKSLGLEWVRPILKD